jgi:sugar phosphate isomerase/epimerase
MRPSLSVRIAESADRKDVAAVPIETLAPLAKELGYQGLSMRASVLSVDSPPERVAEVKALLDRLGLEVSMVTGDLALAANTGVDATNMVRNVTPYLDLAEKLDAKLLRVMLRSVGDIPRAQRAADEATERGMKLAHQMHWGTLFETVDDALTTVQLINRPNGFGVTYEPANLLLCGGDWGPEAIKHLGPHIVNAYFQNIVLDEQSPTTWPSFRRGAVRYRYVPFADASGIDIRIIVATLKEIGYDGWFSVHQPLQPGQTAEEAAREAADALLPLL